MKNIKINTIFQTSNSGSKNDPISISTLTKNNPNKLWDYNWYLTEQKTILLEDILNNKNINWNYNRLIQKFQEKYLPYLYRNYFVKRSKLMIKLHKEIVDYVFNPIRWSRKREFELGFNLVDYESDDSDESNESGDESCSEPKYKKLKKVY